MNDLDSARDEHKLISERRKKLARLRDLGQAFPNDFKRDALAFDLHTALMTCKKRSWMRKRSKLK